MTFDQFMNDYGVYIVGGIAGITTLGSIAIMYCHLKALMKRDEKAKELGIKKVEAYRCPKCKKTIEGSLQKAVEHAEQPELKLPEGFVWKDNTTHPERWKEHRSKGLYFYIPNECQSVIQQDHSYEQRACALTEDNLDNLRLFRATEAGYSVENSREVARKLREGKYSFLTEKEFEEFQRLARYIDNETVQSDVTFKRYNAVVERFLRTTPELERLVEEGKMKLEFEKNIEFFEQHKEEIRSKYGEDVYVVIEGQKIIDSGKDNFELAEKYEKRHGLAITSVKDSETEYHIESPECEE